MKRTKVIRYKTDKVTIKRQQNYHELTRLVCNIASSCNSFVFWHHYYKVHGGVCLVDLSEIISTSKKVEAIFKNEFKLKKLKPTHYWLSTRFPKKKIKFKQIKPKKVL